MIFKVKQGNDGQWYASVVGGNGEPMLSSEAHPDKQTAVDALIKVKVNCINNNIKWNIEDEETL